MRRREGSTISRIGIYTALRYLCLYLFSFAYLALFYSTCLHLIAIFVTIIIVIVVVVVELRVFFSFLL